VRAFVPTLVCSSGDRAPLERVASDLAGVLHGFELIAELFDVLDMVAYAKPV
jgi:hypothetical protein